MKLYTLLLLDNLIQVTVICRTPVLLEKFTASTCCTDLYYLPYTYKVICKLTQMLHSRTPGDGCTFMWTSFRTTPFPRARTLFITTSMWLCNAKQPVHCCLLLFIKYTWKVNSCFNASNNISVTLCALDNTTTLTKCQLMKASFTFSYIFSAIIIVIFTICHKLPSGFSPNAAITPMCMIEVATKQH